MSYSRRSGPIWRAPLDILKSPQRTALLLDDCVIAVRQETLAHGVGFFLVVEGSDLDVNEIVATCGTGRDGIAAGAERSNQEVGVLLMRYSGYLDHEGSSLHRG